MGAMYYSQPLKPVNEIKTEISKSAIHLRYSLIGIIVAMLTGYTLSMFVWYGDMSIIAFVYIISFGAFVMVAIGVYGLYHLYKISQNFEDLGAYYWQHTQSAKKTAEMLKISLIVFLFTGGTIGAVFYIIACKKLAETFKELNAAGLYPKKESEFLFKSAIAITIGIFLLLASFMSFYIGLFSWAFQFSIIFYSISELLLIVAIIVHLFALRRFSADILLIIEKEPSPRSIPTQAVYGQPQPVPDQVSYITPTQKETSIPSKKFKEEVVDQGKDFCSQCGEKIGKKNVFCPYCGKNRE